MSERNPQAAQMADESMVRNLAAQAEAIWPQESALFDRYRLPAAARVLDVGCGTGEISSRLAQRFPDAHVLGVDLLERHLALARSRYGSLGGRLELRRGDAFALDLPDGSFDLTVCRHMLQAVPHAPRVLAELARVTRPGGRLHLLAEDYGMIHFAGACLDVDGFWREGPVAYGRATGTDLYIGRNVTRHLQAMGLEEIALDYVVVDPLRVRRETIAAIWEAWRDGYTEAIAATTRFSASEVRALFDEMIACTLRPSGYAVWHVPIASARVP